MWKSPLQLQLWGHLAVVSLLGYTGITTAAELKSKTAYQEQPDLKQYVTKIPEQEVSISTSVADYLIATQPIEADTTICADLREIARLEGQGTPDICNNSVYDVSTSSSSAEPQSQPQPTTPTAEAEDVLLIHGFSITANHDCNDYWGAQEKAIEKVDGNGNLTRRAITIGWYAGNTNCDVDLPDNNPIDPTPDPLENNVFGIHTPLIDVAWELRVWIFNHYTQHGKSVDIVAHSLGGLVVRVMLEQWGQELLVSDVVTLGTPHGGVQTTLLAPFCWAIGQCNGIGAGSEFITELQHNPQSAITTHWSLIAAANDQVIGNGSGMQMDSGDGPEVEKFEYEFYHKHGCSHVLGAFTAIGHQDLQGDAAALPVHECNLLGMSVDTVDNPTKMILNALD